VDVVVAAIQGEDIEAEIRIHITVLNIVKIIIQQISIGTNLVKLSRLRVLKLQTPPLLLLLFRSSKQTMSISFSYIPVS